MNTSVVLLLGALVVGQGEPRYRVQSERAESPVYTVERVECAPEPSKVVPLPAVPKVAPKVRWHPYQQPDFQKRMDGMNQQDRLRSLGRIRRQTSNLRLIAPRYQTSSTPAFRAGSC
jgi:hypothetical protein